MPRTTPPRALRAAALAAVLAAAAVSAPSAMAAPSLTKVNISQATQGSVGGDLPGNSASTSGATYFVVGSGSHPGVYRTDGTAGGTSLVKAYDAEQSGAQNLTAVGEKVFFTLNEGQRNALWVTDGTTAGTAKVGGNPLVNYNKVASVGGKLYVLGAEAGGNDTLWVTDGTDGVVRAPALSGAPTIDFWASGSKLFVLGDQGDGHELGVLSGDGSSASPVLFDGGSVNPNRELVAQSADGDLYFTVSGSSQLYVSDGTDEGTQMVEQDGDPYSIDPNFSRFIATSDGVALQSNPYLDNQYTQRLVRVVGNQATDVAHDQNLQNVAPVGSPSTLVFTSYDGTYGNELFTTDPDSLTPRVISDVVPGTANSSLTPRGTAGGKYYFTEEDGNGDIQLWSTTGEVGNAVKVSDVAGGVSLVGDVTQLPDGGVLFPVADALHGAEPWVASGAAGSAHLLGDFNTNLSDASVDGSVEIGGKAWFRANDGTHGSEPWVSDGTAAGTHLVADVLPGAAGSSPSSFAGVSGGRVAFLAETQDSYFGGLSAGDVSASGSSSTAVVVSDGTAGGTTQLTGFSSPSYLTGGAGGKAYFTAYDDANDGQLSLWVTDGTQAGTHTVALNLPDGNDGLSRLRNLTRAGDKVFAMVRYYDANENRVNHVLSISADGTASVSPTDVGTFASLTAVGDRVAFQGYSEDEGYEPWVSDGTAEGTHVLADVVAGADGSSPGNFVAYDGGIAYSAYASNTYHLWTTAPDGTTTELRVPDGRYPSNAQLLPVGGKLVALFGSYDYDDAAGDVTHIDTPAPTGTELTVLGSDGSFGKLKDFPEADGSGGGLVQAGDKLAFPVGTASGGSAVWTTDGTVDGTTLATDAYGGSALTSAYVVGSASGTLLFSAAVAPDGRQLFLYGQAKAAVVPTTPAATTPAPVATTPEPAAPAPAADAPAPAASAPAPAPKPAASAVVPREVAKKLTTGVKVKDGDTYKVSGKLSLPKGSKGKCEGTVTLKVYAGRKLIATFHAPVKATKDGCTYAKVFTLSDKAAAVAGKRTVKVTFNASSTVHVKHGDATTLPRS